MDNSITEPQFPDGTILNNKYKTKRRLGVGAFGEVYLATHVVLQAPRALKIQRHDAPGVRSTDFVQTRRRFELEAQLGAELKTRAAPHVIEVYDFENLGEVLVLVMEYAPGGNLQDRLDAARRRGMALKVTEALQIAREVAAGLAALHALDVVHRDVKPSNILFDDQGHALLADFGLAQLPGGPSRRAVLSVPAPHPGTPQYMSPEQRKSGAYLTSASDVYTLGTVLFEMLTGRVYHSQRLGTTVKALRPEMPDWVNEVVMGCLAIEPEDRPWDGAEFLKVMAKAETEAQETTRRQHIAEQEQRARTESPPHQARQWFWRIVGLIFVGIAGLLLLQIPWSPKSINTLTPLPTEVETQRPQLLSETTAVDASSPVAATAMPISRSTATPENLAHAQPTNTPTLEPTLTQTPTKLPTLDVADGTTDTDAPTPAPVSTVALIAPLPGEQSKNPVGFSWESSLRPDESYILRTWHVDSAHMVETRTKSTSVEVDVPAEKFGAWRWYLAIIGSSERILTQSLEREFWFNPVPGASGETSDPPEFREPDR